MKPAAPRSSVLADPLLRAWITLIALSAGATALALIRPALGQVADAAAGAVILGLAWLKARVILGRYLGLDAVPGARRAFGVVLGFFTAAALALFLLA